MAITKLGFAIKISAASTALEDLIVEKPTQTQKVLEKKHSDFIYFRARAISAGDQGPLDKEGNRSPNPNGNGDYFSKKELLSSFDSFIGRNLFLNHESDHPVKSIGKIVDAEAIEDPETGEFYIECLSKIDRKLHPEIARKVETGELDKVSMGCSCESSMCSVCGTAIHSDADEKCRHLSPQGLMKSYPAEIDLPDYGIRRGENTKAFAINSGITFNELSIVNVPADSRAVIKTVIANMKAMSKKASLNKEEQLDLLGQFDYILKELDSKTQEEVKAEFCGCPVKEASSMPDNEKEEIKSILSKINGYEYTRLMASIEKKERKVEAEKVEPVQPKNDSFLTHILEKAKTTFAGKMFAKTVERLASEELAKPVETNTSAVTTEIKVETISPVIKAEFKKDEADLSKSTWSLLEGDKVLVSATLGQIWENDATEYTPENMGEEYGSALVARFQDPTEGGVEKIASILGHKVMDVKNSKVEEPAKSEFVKPGTESKADKEADKSEKALDKVDQTEVGTHLDSSKPESEKKEASQEAPIQKEANPMEMCAECKELKSKCACMAKKADEMTNLDTPATDMPEMKPGDGAPAEPKPEEAPGMPGADAPTPETGSAFDKLDDKIVLGEGYEAFKDKETNEIVITGPEGKEVRLEDGFGDDVVTVMKLLRQMLGLKEEGAPGEEKGVPPLTPVEDEKEEPKEEIPGAEPTPTLDQDHKSDVGHESSQKAELTKKAEELSKREADLAKKEDEVKKLQATASASKFSTAVNSRAEKCRTVVTSMVEKDLISVEDAEVEAEIEKGSALLDAREAALKAACNRKLRELVAMDDKALEVFAKSINDLKKTSKRLTKIPHMDWTIDVTGDKDIDNIFKSMGTLKHE